MLLPSTSFLSKPLNLHITHILRQVLHFSAYFYENQWSRIFVQTQLQIVATFSVIHAYGVIFSWSAFICEIMTEIMVPEWHICQPKRYDIEPIISHGCRKSCFS